MWFYGFMEKPGIEPATPGLQGIALIHYTTLIFGIHIYQVKTVCHMLEWLPPLAVLLSYLPSTNLTGETLCAQ